MKPLIFFTMVFIPLFGFPQTGPGGVGTNDGTSTLEFWVEATNGVTGSTPITGWTDLSGNAITNTILGNPSLTTNALNGYDVINFDGTGDYITTSLNISGNTFPQCDIYAVYEQTGTSSAVWGEDNGGFDRFLADANGAGGCDFAVASGTGCVNRAAMFPNATPVITSIQFAEDVANGSSAIVNGVQSGAFFTSNHENETSNNFDVGSIGRINFVMIGDIAEVFVYSENLNSSQQVILHNYLSAKYNIALTGNDLYDEDNVANGNYDHDVAGIGRIDASNIHDDAQGTGIVRILNPTGLDDNEFLIWGHDNGIQQAIENTDVPATVQARFDRVWRASEVNSSSSAVNVGNIDLRFDLNGLGTVTASDLRLLVDTDNDGLFNDETPISGATSVGADIYEFSGVSSIANNLRFTLGTINTSQTPLPIELVYFNATQENNRIVKLEWQTASEMNNDYFTVERSKDGSEWEELSKVNGAGNSTILLSYSSLDQNPYSETSYYRLKQTDFDGQFEYSQIRSINIKQLENSQIEIFPNPATNQIIIKGSSNELGNITLYNTLGQNVTSLTKQAIANENQLIIDISKLNRGMYYIKKHTTVNKVYKQ